MTPEALKTALLTPNKQQRLALIKNCLPGAPWPLLKVILLETARQRTGNALELVLKEVETQIRQKKMGHELNETLLAIYDRTQKSEKRALLALLLQTGYLAPIIKHLRGYPPAQVLDYAERLNQAQFQALFELSPEALKAALDLHLRIWGRRRHQR